VSDATAATELIVALRTVRPGDLNLVLVVHAPGVRARGLPGFLVAVRWRSTAWSRR
jgi:hypothetical protein